MEQLLAKLGLQALNAPGDIGLYGVELARGRENTALFDYGEEGSQRRQLHSVLL